MTNFQEKVSFIWSLADLIRNSYKRNEYQKVILPFTVLKRFDDVLKHSKQDVLDTYNKYGDKIQNLDSILMPVAVDEDGNRLNFYNYSKYDFNSLLEDPENIEENLIHYLDSFSENVQDIFENFEMKNQVSRLKKADLLFLLIKSFNETKVDLSPKVVSNHEMGTIFEELIRKFSEQSNDEAGEHFTPRDVVKLMTGLMFADEDLSQRGLIRKVYDPACGTGGMLTACKEHISSLNDNVKVVLYGQEINPEIYAVCKADMLMKGENANNIKGPKSTLSEDQLAGEHFDYMISNPPYGRDWTIDYEAVMSETELGYDGRFGAGVPRKNDGQLLFLQHMISKMKADEKSRIAVITNGSPLFTGDAGSGESEIRKWIFENDYLEAIVALPDQLFYNTGINTYIWILTNKKSSERIGKVQLIDASDEFDIMRKSLGSKRHEILDEHINGILESYSEFVENDNVKIFNNDDFGYTKITVERPMQLNYQVTSERLENLYSYNQFRKLSESNSKDPEIKRVQEAEGKEKQEAIKKALLTIGDELYVDWDTFEAKVKQALSSFDLKTAFIKNVIEKLSEHDDTAEYVTDSKGKPKADSNLRDTEKIPLIQNIDDYFEDEVLKYYPDAWYDAKKNKVGYEINFTQYFYVYEPPRPLEEIEADISEVTAKIQELLMD